MKFDTQKATPIKASPGCQKVENPYIPVSRENDKNYGNSKLGREKSYDAHVVLSPTMKSTRIEQTHKADVIKTPIKVSKEELDEICDGVSTLTVKIEKKCATSVDDLCDELSNLSLKKPAAKSAKKVAPLTPPTNNGEPLGLITKQVRHSDTGKLVSVRRSARNSK